MLNPSFLINLLGICDYMLKNGLTVSIFGISTFSIYLRFFSIQLMEISPMIHNFWEKRPLAVLTCG